jgi:hypothetical protein
MNDLRIIKQESAMTPMEMMPSLLANSLGTHLVEVMLPTAKVHVSEIASINPLAAYLNRNSNYHNTRLFASAIAPPIPQREEVVNQLVKSIIDFMEPNQIAIVFLGMDHVLICMNTLYGPLAMSTYKCTIKERPNLYTIVSEQMHFLLQGLEWTEQVNDDVITFILGAGDMKFNNLHIRAAILLQAEKKVCNLG